MSPWVKKKPTIHRENIKTYIKFIITQFVGQNIFRIFSAQNRNLEVTVYFLKVKKDIHKKNGKDK
jgi:uncharacterized protein YbcI